MISAKDIKNISFIAKENGIEKDIICRFAETEFCESLFKNIEKSIFESAEKGYSNSIVSYDSLSDDDIKNLFDEFCYSKGFYRIEETISEYIKNECTRNGYKAEVDLYRKVDLDTNDLIIHVSVSLDWK